MVDVKLEHVLIVGGVVAGGVAVIWYLTRPAAGAQVGSLSGRVIDLTTNSPIVGAVVESQGKSTAADAEGLWVLTGLVPGATMVTFSAPGYSGWTQEFTVLVDQDTPVGDVPLQPTVTVGRVFGVMVDANTLQPIDGAVVTIAGQTDVTGPDGVFDFRDIPTGQYILTADATDYAGIQMLRTVLEGDNDLGSIGLNPTQTPAPTVSVTANPTSGQAPLLVAFQAAAEGDLPLTYAWNFGDGGFSQEQNPLYLYASPSNYTAVCTVTDPSGRQAQDSEVITVTSAPPTLTAELLASPETGEAPLLVQFTARGIGGNGPYTYQFVFGDGNGGLGQGWSYSIANNYLNPGTYLAEVAVTDLDGETATDQVTIIVTPPTAQLGTVRGVVRDVVTLLPVWNARVEIDVYVGITDGLGNFVIPDIPYATYNMLITAAGYQPLQQGITIFQPDWDIGILEMMPTAAQTARIYGTVVDALTNLPLPGATVEFNSYTDVTDANGDWEILNVPYATYNYTVSAPGYTTQTIPFPVQDPVEFMGTLSLSPVTSGSTVIGRVLEFPGGMPIVGARVELNGYVGFTDVNGEFSIPNVPIDFYTYSVTAVGYYTIGGTKVVDEVIENMGDLLMGSSGAVLPCFFPEDPSIIPPSGLNVDLTCDSFPWYPGYDPDPTIGNTWTLGRGILYRLGEEAAMRAAHPLFDQHPNNVTDAPMPVGYAMYFGP